MQDGEVIVARLSRGASVVKYLGEAESRVKVAINRNRQARIPTDRVLLATGLVMSTDDEVEEFRRQCEEMASATDLSDIWEVVVDETATMGADDLAELLWGPRYSVIQRVALVIQLDRSPDYFVYGKEGYTPRTRTAVEEIQTRRRREAENAEAAASLMQGLAEGRMPADISRHQAALLDNLRGYVVHGDDYPRAAAARGLLEPLADGARDLQRRSFELLVGAGVFSADEPLEVHRAGVRTRYPGDALDEAAGIDLEGLVGATGRRDLTALPTVTVDEAESEDRDDALSLVVDAGGDTPNSSFHIGIHITDAGVLVPGGGAMDREADRRMATLYLPEGKIGMLPSELVSRTGSLEAGEARIGVSLLARVSASGEVLDWEVAPSIVRSQAALTYEEADRVLEDEADPWHLMLTSLCGVSDTLRRRRETAGAVIVPRSEMVIRIRSQGRVEVVVRRSTPARELVAELMILCNSLLAEFCREAGVDAAYRSQVAPDLSDILADVRSGSGIPDTPLVRHLVMKRLLPAELDIVPAPHGGLGVRAYIQATSPLRRFPDLVMQRQISHYLESGKALYSSEAVASVAQRAEVQLRELARLEEQRKRYWFLKYLEQSYLPETGPSREEGLFSACVLENDSRRLALMELSRYPFRVRAELPRSCVPGDTVTLRLHGVDLWRRTAHFVHIDH